MFSRSLRTRIPYAQDAVNTNCQQARGRGDTGRMVRGPRLVEGWLALHNHHEDNCSLSGTTTSRMHHSGVRMLSRPPRTPLYLIDSYRSHQQRSLTQSGQSHRDYSTATMVVQAIFGVHSILSATLPLYAAKNPLCLLPNRPP